VGTVIDVRDSVVGALAESFPGVAIYTESISPGLMEPHFRVTDFSVTHNRIMGPRYVCVYAFKIQYYPSSNSSEPIREACTVAERLVEALEYIPMESGRLRGTGMRYEMVEGVMYFFFDIKMDVMKQEQSGPAMAAMDMEGWIK